MQPACLVFTNLTCFDPWNKSHNKYYELEWIISNHVFTIDSFVIKLEMKEMDQLIKIVNRLQDAFASVNVSNPIDLPQIVVIGR